MITEPWISLMDYSNKYHVSLSTLRRRIKNNQMKYQFRAGKYYLTDKPMSIQPEAPELTIQNAPPEPSQQNSTNKVSIFEDSQLMSDYLSELKKAYSQVLHEKEDVIQILREEISDLKTLVKVLEVENQRLNSTTVQRF
ncbi:MAG: hypothetical protein A4S09_08805 [Proteobacteria bacterium SG_bin7]|nr:MAG: hypothetical protein A4S09_08805 [Proteobacteria bacterium SG_bin7]